MGMSLERLQLMTAGMIDHEGDSNDLMLHELAWKDAIVFLGSVVERKKTLQEIQNLAFLFSDMIFDDNNEESIYELVEYEMDYKDTALENYSIAANDKEVEVEYALHFVGILLYLINIWESYITDVPYFKGEDIRKSKDKGTVYRVYK